MHLSGGERQRVAIARALVGSPDLILADEPTSQLDSNSAATVGRLLQQAAHEFQTAVVVTTHDPRLGSIADRRVALESGVLHENKRHWLVHGVGALVFGSTAMFVRDSILPEFGRPYRTPTAEVARPGLDARPRTVVCSGRVESVRGEVEVSALISGRLEEVRVTEGDSVREGDILTILEGARETEELRTAEANVTVARLKLEQVQAGNGKEEIDQAYEDVRALEAKLAYEKTNLECLRRLYQKRALTSDELQRKMHEVEQMMRQRDSLQKRYEAVRRGPLPEQIEVARGELAVAETRLQRSKVEMGLSPDPCADLGDRARGLPACWRRREHGIRHADPPDRRHEPPADPARDRRAGRRAPAQSGRRAPSRSGG